MLTLNVNADSLVKELVESDGYRYCEPIFDAQWSGGVEVTDPLDKFCLHHDQPYRYCKQYQNNRQLEILNILTKYSSD